MAIILLLNSHFLITVWKAYFPSSFHLSAEPTWFKVNVLYPNQIEFRWWGFSRFLAKYFRLSFPISPKSKLLTFVTPISSIMRLVLNQKLLNSVAADFQTMKINLFNKVFVSEGLSKLENSNLGNFLISSQLNFRKSAHISWNQLSQL